MDQSSAARRYRDDMVFRALTDQFRALIAQSDSITPSDVRAAALLAATMDEYQRIRPIVVRGQGPLELWKPEVWERK